MHNVQAAIEIHACQISMGLDWMPSGEQSSSGSICGTIVIVVAIVVEVVVEVVVYCSSTIVVLEAVVY